MNQKILEGTPVVVNSIKMVKDTNPGDGTTHFAITLTYPASGAHPSTLTNYSADGNSKVPGGAGVFGARDGEMASVVLYALNARIENIKGTRYTDSSTGKDYVIIDMVIPSKLRSEPFTNDEVANYRAIGVHEVPFNICTTAFTTILVSKVSASDYNTKVQMTFPV